MDTKRAQEVWDELLPRLRATGTTLASLDAKARLAYGKYMTEAMGEIVIPHGPGPSPDMCRQRNVHVFGRVRNDPDEVFEALHFVYRTWKTAKKARKEGKIPPGTLESLLTSLGNDKAESRLDLVRAVLDDAAAVHTAAAWERDETAQMAGCHKYTLFGRDPRLGDIPPDMPERMAVALDRLGARVGEDNVIMVDGPGLTDHDITAWMRLLGPNWEWPYGTLFIALTGPMVGKNSEGRLCVPGMAWYFTKTDSMARVVCCHPLGLEDGPIAFRGCMALHVTDQTGRVCLGDAATPLARCIRGLRFDMAIDTLMTIMENPTRGHGNILGVPGHEVKCHCGEYVTRVENCEACSVELITGGRANKHNCVEFRGGWARKADLIGSAVQRGVMLLRQECEMLGGILTVPEEIVTCCISGERCVGARATGSPYPSLRPGWALPLRDGRHVSIKCAEYVPFEEIMSHESYPNRRASIDYYAGWSGIGSRYGDDQYIPGVRPFRAGPAGSPHAGDGGHAPTLVEGVADHPAGT